MLKIPFISISSLTAMKCHKFYSSVGAVIILIILGSFLTFKVSAQDLLFNLTILHTNDIQSRFCQVDENRKRCTDELAADGMCYGGYARTVTKVKEIRASKENVLLLEGGERLFGIPAWYETYLGLAASHFMNQLGYDATVSCVSYLH